MAAPGCGTCSGPETSQDGGRSHQDKASLRASRAPPGQPCSTAPSRFFMPWGILCLEPAQSIKFFMIFCLSLRALQKLPFGSCQAPAASSRCCQNRPEGRSGAASLKPGQELCPVLAVGTRWGWSPGHELAPAAGAAAAMLVWSMSEQVPCSKGETRRELLSNEKQPLEQALLRNYPAD